MRRAPFGKFAADLLNKVCSALDPDKVRSEGRCKERGKRVSLNFVPDTC